MRVRVAPCTQPETPMLMRLYLSKSSTLRQFKHMLGQANHKIITVLVGLYVIENDMLENEKLAAIPHELRVAWSPKDRVRSAERSRILTLNMALVYSVDALDVYFRGSNTKPFLNQSQALQSKIDQAGQSVYKKFLAFENHFPTEDETLSALIALMITWRNRAVHTTADNEVCQHYKNVLATNIDEIKARFHGLDSTVLLAGYNASRNPHFKEVASFMNATHHYVNVLEQALFRELNPTRFLKELVWTGISTDISLPSTASKPRNEVRKQHLNRIWGKNPSNKRQAVTRFLQRHGLSLVETTDCHVVFDDDLLDDLTSKTPTEVFSWVRPVQDSPLQEA